MGRLGSQTCFVPFIRIALVLAGCLLMGFSIGLLAQTSRGTVSGTVVDASGGVLPGVTTILTNTQTGVVRTTTTNEVGLYRFDAVDLGEYTVRVTMPGFKNFVSSTFTVEANRTATIDAKLEVGVGDMVIEVSGAKDELLTKDAPLRGGNFKPGDVANLPIAGLEPISLARTLPGVILPSGSSTFGNGGSGTQFAINGQRPRGNNYMLDGTENNDISVGGNAQAFTILDAVQEVSVQTSNFGVEFGRAGGGVINVITKSGTNDLHGTLLWQYRSQRFDARTNADVLNATPKSVFSHNIYGFTLGGPIIKNKTFFYGGFQQDTRRSTSNYNFTVPTAEGVALLRSLFPNNPRLDLYLNTIGNLRGVANIRPLPVGLGVDPVTGVNRDAVPFTIGTARASYPLTNEGPQWLAKIDHNLSNAHRMSFRYIYDSRLVTPNSVYLPGFIADFKGRDQNFLFNDSYTFSPTWTNEFRFSYGRIGFSFPISSKSITAAATLPVLGLPTLSNLGVPSTIPQYRFANNWLFQETQSKVLNRHTLRYGVELLRQLAAQRPPFNARGSYAFTNAAGYSGFANFLDNFSGPSGSTARNFGAPVYHPNLFRQSYYLQDTWRVTLALTLTLGLRYENFGQPANIFPYPAFAGFDPANFLVPNKVKRDNNNFGPSVGFAWSPSYTDGWLGKLFGNRKMVWRGGFQVSYDSLFNNLLSNLAADSPNTISTQVTGAPATVNPRGTNNFMERLPTAARQAAPLDSQTSVFDPNLRNPYTERWSLGFQRELPNNILLDLSYVGSASHKLLTNEDLNPLLPTGQRLYPNLGIRRMRASEGNSNYHAMQLRVDRRFAASFQVGGSYTWSRTIDSTSEVFATTQSNSSFTSVPISQGGLKLDRALSDYHRAHRLALIYRWDVPGPKSGFWRHPFGGWAVTGITTFQSGAPYTVINGFDRNSDGMSGPDRPDIGNPNAPLNTRAVIATNCGTGYRNPDTGACVTPADVHFVQGQGFPTAATVGRNTLLAGGVHNWDMDFFKTFVIRENRKLEFRWEAFNVFNHPQFTGVPDRNVLGTAGPSSGLPSRFLTREYVTAGVRTMRVQLKFLF